MYETLSDRPISPKTIVSDSIGMYASHYLAFAAVLAATGVPQAILDGLADSEEVGLGLSVVLISLSFVVSLLQEGAVVHTARQAYEGPYVHPIQSLRAGLLRLRPLFGASALLVLTVAGLTLTIVGIPFAFYWGVRWSFASQAVVLEGCGARAALARSSQLVSGHWWRVFGTTVIISVIQFIVVTGATLIVNTRLTSIDRLLALGVSSWGLVASIIAAIPTILLGAFWAIGMTHLYFELLDRQEVAGSDTLAT